MSSSKHEDSTQHLIQAGEALRSAKSGKAKRPPSTRQIIHEAERLIGRTPSAAGNKSLLRWVLILSVVAVVLAGLFFMLV